MAFDGTLKFDTAVDKSGFEKGLDSLGSIAQKGMSVVSGAVAAATGAITAATGAVAALGAGAISAGTEFETSFAQLETIMDTNLVSVSDMSDALRALSGEMGLSAAELAGTAYNAISATGDTVGAMDIVENASKLAVAGFTDSASALSTLTTVMNAYGMTAEETAQISDSLIQVQNLGVTTVSELSASMGKAIASASAYGVDLYNLESAYVSMTKSGISTAESTTYLSSMFKELGDSGSTVSGILLEKTGKSFSELMADGYTLGDVLGILSDSVDGNATALMNLWGSAEAGKASNALLSQGLAEFNANLETIQTSTGTTQAAFETMSDTLDFKMNQLKQSGMNVLIGIYDEMQPALSDLVDLGLDSISQLSEAFETGGFEGLTQALGDVLGQAVTQVASYVPELTDLAVSLVHSLVSGLISNAPSIAEAGLLAGMTLLEGIFSISADLFELGASLLVTFADSIEKRLPRIKRITGSIIRQMSGSLSENLPLILEAGASIIGSLAEVLLDDLPLLIESGKEIFASFSEQILTSENLQKLLDIGKQFLLEISQAVSENLPLLVTSALSLVQSFCETLLTGENLQTVLDAGLQILLAVAQAITDGLPLLVEIAVQILTFLCTELLSADNLTSLAETALQIITALVDAIVSNTGTLLPAVEEIIESIRDELSDPENLARMCEIGAELLRVLITGICDVSGQFAEFALRLHTEACDRLYEMDWGALGTAIVEGICSGLLDCDFVLDEYLSDFGANWISGIKEIFGIHSPSKVMEDDVGKYLALGIGEGFADEMRTAGQNALQSLQTLSDDLRDTAGTGLSELVSMAAGQLGTLPSAMADTGQEMLQSLTAWTDDLHSTAENAISGLVQTITDTLRTLPETMTSVGSDLVTGLWNGITGMGDWLKDRISGFGESVLAGFKDVFGIHSPSALMRDEVGAFLAQGIGVGFTETLPDVSRDAVNAFAPLRQTVDAQALSAFEMQSLSSDTGIVRPSATSEVVNNHYSYSTVNHNTTTNEPQTMNFTPTVNVYVGDQEIRDIVVSVIDTENAVTGGNAF